jgi:hypothetical protein
MEDVYDCLATRLLDVTANYSPPKKYVYATLQLVYNSDMKSVFGLTKHLWQVHGGSCRRVLMPSATSRPLDTPSICFYHKQGGIKYGQVPSCKPYLPLLESACVLEGVPGSGKSTTTLNLSRRINEMHGGCNNNKEPELSVVVPMDGRWCIAGFQRTLPWLLQIDHADRVCC